MIESSLHPSEPLALPDRPFGRLVRSVIGYGLLLTLMIVGGIPMFVPAVLIHCALRNGHRATWASLAMATVLGALLGAAQSTPDLTRAAASAIAGVILAIALPTMMALPLVERAESFGRVLMAMLIFSAIGLAITELGARVIASFSPFAIHVAQAKAMSEQFAQTYRAGGMPSDAVRFAERWGMYYATVLLPAGMLLSSAMSFVLSLLMTGRLRAWREHVARRGNVAGNENGAPNAYVFRNFSLPDWVLFVFVIGGVAPLLTGMLQNIAANVLMVAVFLYIVQGLALLRYLLAAVGIGFIGALVAFAFTFVSGIGPLLLGVAGLFDPFFDFRHFKKRKDDSHESHSD